MKTPTGQDQTPKAILLKDYAQPDFWIPKTELTFELREEKTTVHSTLHLERNLTQAASKTASLVLNGEDVKLLSVAVDGRELLPTEYVVNDTTLTVPNVPDAFKLSVVTEIEPQKNLSCEGLYKSSGTFCTQCEAESFRKITYFADRPDVMSVFTVTVRAEKAKYPVLLSNGNPISRRDLENGRHEVVWNDPFKKPCYLFALVAGDLGVLRDTYKTRSGREVKLEIYTRHALVDRCHHAMESIKWSMKWDEDTYGLEYDLDIFMIVVAEDFNMGAMENKGLNVFNANYILAKPETATDTDYENITAVVGHEYFHNWTGNRVTCRDWFQLSLKEGLTVFRDQRFSADLESEAVNRVEQVIGLRTGQFAEDAGPMAHPIRPSSYISINNFYTMTVYEKGAEVIRMIETILGRDGFRKGMDLYFKRHDGQAVTTEDFVAAMADANGVDFTLFKNWYDQAGTPEIRVEAQHDAAKQTYTLTIEQSCAPSPGQPTKKPYHIPVLVGLIGRDGKDLPLALSRDGSSSVGELHAGAQSVLLHLRSARETFTFTGVAEKPVLSLLRKFSAPVRAVYDASDADLAFQISHDSDAFAKWEAAQTLVVRAVRNLLEDRTAGREFRSIDQLTNAFGPVLDAAMVDPSFTSLMLSLPAEQYLAQFYKVVDVDGIHAVREHIAEAIARVHEAKFRAIFTDLAARGTEGLGGEQSGLRALRGSALHYLARLDQPRDLDLALAQLRGAKNMTDQLSALNALNRTEKPQRQVAMDEFYNQWKDESLVINKWLQVQSVSPLASTLENIRKLAASPSFDANNPNKIYALYLAFAKANAVRFHDLSGEAYKLIADQVIEIDARNPQVASRLMSTFNQWRSFDSKRQELMKTQLTRILEKPGISSNVFEIASKALN